jgi:hypothetical protein
MSAVGSSNSSRSGWLQGQPNNLEVYLPLFFECYYANKIFRPATYLVQGIRPLINFEVLIE